MNPLPSHKSLALQTIPYLICQNLHPPSPLLVVIWCNWTLSNTAYYLIILQIVHQNPYFCGQLAELLLFMYCKSMVSTVCVSVCVCVCVCTRVHVRVSVVLQNPSKQDIPEMMRGCFRNSICSLSFQSLDQVENYPTLPRDISFNQCPIDLKKLPLK